MPEIEDMDLEELRDLEGEIEHRLANEQGMGQTIYEQLSFDLEDIQERIEELEAA